MYLWLNLFGGYRKNGWSAFRHSFFGSRLFHSQSPQVMWSWAKIHNMATKLKFDFLLEKCIGAHQSFMPWPRNKQKDSFTCLARATADAKALDSPNCPAPELSAMIRKKNGVGKDIVGNLLSWHVIGCLPPVFVEQRPLVTETCLREGCNYQESVSTLAKCSFI